MFADALERAVNSNIEQHSVYDAPDDAWVEDMADDDEAPDASRDIWADHPYYDDVEDYDEAPDDSLDATYATGLDDASQDPDLADREASNVAPDDDQAVEWEAHPYYDQDVDDQTDYEDLSEDDPDVEDQTDYGDLSEDVAFENHPYYL